MIWPIQVYYRNDMITIYSVINNGIDGLDSRVVARFTSKEDAERASIGFGTMGYGNGQIIDHKVYESYDEYDPGNIGYNKKMEHAKNAALAKLSDVEKKLLGLE